MTRDVIIIGAGHNGLACAALLARSGRRPLVLEARSDVGGLAADYEFHPGYRACGPLDDTSRVRRAVVEKLDLASHGLELCSAPAIFAPQLDGPGLLLHSDPERAAGEIRRHSAQDAERYFQYRAFLARIRGVISDWLDHSPPDIYEQRLASLAPLARGAFALRRLGPKDMLETLRVLPMCVADWLNEWFETELLRCALAPPALQGAFLGPWSPGSAANLIFAECAAQAWVRGGGPALVGALERAALAAGVEIRAAARVAEIRVRRRAAVGVTLSDGQRLDAATLIATCDPRQTFLELLPRDALSQRLEGRMLNFRANGAVAVVNLALRGPLEFASRPGERFERVRIVETLDDIERAFDAAKHRGLPLAPTLEIRVPTESRPDWAPPGHSVASVLAHYAPHDLEGGWTAAHRSEFEEAVVQRLAAYAPAIREQLVACETLVPPDLERRYGLSGGHLHHGDEALDQRLLRPTPECARGRTPVANLFVGGSGAHPGGGLTCVPGALAAAAVCAHSTLPGVATGR